MIAREKTAFPLSFVFAALIVGFLIVDPASAFWRWGVADPDDAMRMAQVMDFMQGQAWHDVQQHRFIDGEIRWSRLADLPLAAVASLFHLFLPLRAALKAASLVLPLLLLGFGLFPLVASLSKKLTGNPLGALAVALVYFSPNLLFQFMPARVDHHALQILIAGFGLWGFFTLLNPTLPQKHPALARYLPFALGVAHAAGLWIGTEAVPFVALFSILLGAAVIAMPNQLAKPVQKYALTLIFATAIFLPLGRPLSELLSLEVSWFSLTTVAFTGLSVCVLVGVSTFPKKMSIPLRSACWISLGLIASAVFFWLFPEALQGPYANMDEAGQRLILDSVTEAQPLVRKMRFSGHGVALFCHSVAVPLGLTLYGAVKSLGRDKVWHYRALFLHLAVTLGASLFWQARVLHFTQLFMIPLACAALKDGSLFFKDRLHGRGRFGAEMLLLAALSVLPIMVVPALLTPQTKSLAAFFKPFERPRPAFTDPDPVLAFLNDPLDFGQKPRRILTPMDLGADLLFATPHAVFAAPYKAPHNEAIFALYREHDMDKAYAMVQALKVDALLTPRRIAPAYAGLQNRAQLIGATPKTGKDGSLYLETDAQNPTLLERILRNQPPHWLKNIEIDGQNGYVFSQILK